jgi:hypothetical protein
VRYATTDDAGLFVFASLAPGRYQAALFEEGERAADQFAVADMLELGEGESKVLALRH